LTFPIPRELTVAASKLSDPEWRAERARKAAAARHSVDTYIDSIVAKAPELTAEQKSRLSNLLAVQP
jgi:hypothetical protein